MRRFLMTPAPRGAGTIQCYIKRKKSGFSKMFPEYRVYMKLPEEVSACVSCVYVNA